MSIIQDPFRGDQRFFVHTGDVTSYFKYRKSYRWSYLKQVFKERIQQCPSCSHPYELFPGAVLQDEEGKLWKVQLQAVLVPAEQPVSPGEIQKPEEENVKGRGV